LKATASSLDWNDIKIFLALARRHSVRAAAADARVSHSTVARRIVALEKRLGARLFNRTPAGYEITAAGAEMLVIAEEVARDIDSMERRVSGRDQRLAGRIRIATVDFLATSLLPPCLADFSRRYPEIDFEILIGYKLLDLSRREADIALRFTRTPPPHLVGKRLARAAIAPYASHDYLRQHDLSGDTACWIGYGARGTGGDQGWVRRTAYPHLPVRGVFESLLTQHAATKAGLGIGMLPCMLGDIEPTLRRVPPARDLETWDLWLLTHRDVRTTARLRAFAQFIAQQVTKQKLLIEGRAKPYADGGTA
jgi:DNA-binding transcriptional LysR family regulator